MTANEKVEKALYAYRNCSSSAQRDALLDILLASAAYSTLRNACIELGIDYKNVS